MATRRPVSETRTKNKGGMSLRMAVRLSELEARLARLEARVRAFFAEDSTPRGKGALRPRRQGPVCPGCSLELPRGRKAETCVWCGFRFDALRHFARRRR